MEILRLILVVLHLLGMAIIVGGYFSSMKAPRVLPGMLHGAYLQLVTGLLLTVIAEFNAGDESVNHMKIGIKVILGIAVAVFAFIGRRKEKANPGEGASSGMAHATGLSAILAVIVASTVPGFI